MLSIDDLHAFTLITSRYYTITAFVSESNHMAGGVGLLFLVVVRTTTYYKIVLSLLVDLQFNLHAFLLIGELKWILY